MIFLHPHLTKYSMCFIRVIILRIRLRRKDAENEENLL